MARRTFYIPMFNQLCFDVNRFAHFDGGDKFKGYPAMIESFVNFDVVCVESGRSCTRVYFGFDGEFCKVGKLNPLTPSKQCFFFFRFLRFHFKYTCVLS